MAYRALNPERIERTVERLLQRVEQRFPGSGLAGVVRELLGIARHTAETAIWISRPLIPLRVAIGFLGILMLVGLLVSLRSLQVQMGPPTLPELAQGIESAIGDVVYVAVAVFFLTTIETRIKRRRALRAIHELRSIAHVDRHAPAHQGPGVGARARPGDRARPAALDVAVRAVPLPRLLLGELSLTGKVAALYIQRFETPWHSTP